MENTTFKIHVGISLLGKPVQFTDKINLDRKFKFIFLSVHNLNFKTIFSLQYIII